MSAPYKPNIVQGPPGPKGQAIIDRDRANSSPSYIKAYPLVVDRGEGPWVFDPDGNCFLDFMSGIATTSTGHAHPEVVQAIQSAAARFLHICGTDFFYQSFSDLCERLAGYLPEMGPKKVFLTNSGSEATDGAIKLVRNHTKRQYIIAFRGAFHGRTMGAISLNASKAKYRSGFGPLIGSVFHVPYPPSEPFASPERDGASYATYIEEEIFARYVSPTEVAAVFVEPILGEGGYIIPPDGFLRELRRICDAHGIVLVFDEVQSGIGRTGRMFAAEHSGVMPDVVLSAKGIASGMPIGAIIAKDSVMTWGRGSHGSTYGGNPVCCAAALATLNIVERELDHITEVGAYLRASLRELQSKHEVLADVRGLGLMVGAEFLVPGSGKPADTFVEDLEQRCFRRGLLILSCGRSTIRFAPPLIIGRREVDMAIEILDRCISDISEEMFGM